MKADTFGRQRIVLRAIAIQYPVKADLFGRRWRPNRSAFTKKFLRAAAGSEESKGQKTMQTTNIEHLASQYPHLAAAFATIPQGEAHLRRLHDLNDTWQNLLRSGQTRDYTEVVITEQRPALLPQNI